MTEPQQKFIVVDGKQYPIPKIKFKALKKCFPVLERVQNADDPMTMADAAIEVVSICMIKEYPDMTPEWFEDNLDIEESVKLGEMVTDIMERAGLISLAEKVGLSGEEPGAAPSTETSTPSSPNSSQQDAAAETGT